MVVMALIREPQERWLSPLLDSGKHSLVSPRRAYPLPPDPVRPRAAPGPVGPSPEPPRRELSVSGGAGTLCAVHGVIAGRPGRPCDHELPRADRRPDLVRLPAVVLLAGGGARQSEERITWVQGGDLYGHVRGYPGCSLRFLPQRPACKQQ